ncbi:DNA gyrase/topoisomerase IV subunit A, partial [Parabacteroides sp. OttesenSCG-928-O15]|nr:DNA gyrase/topoisomerase IV subunit A [Parabacteroides sp. OttesenSCG-928-O15]
KQNFIGENPESRLFLLTDEVYPRIEVIFGGNDDFREPLVIDAEEFIGVKGFKAKGKRITTFEVKTINELEPTRFPDPTAPAEESQTVETDEEDEPEEERKSDTDILDEITGQMKLFDD